MAALTGTTEPVTDEPWERACHAPAAIIAGKPEGASRVGDGLSILKKGGRVTYFVGGDSYYSHREGDGPSYRFILATLVENGRVWACEVEQALCGPHRTLMDWLRRYREEGPDASYRAARRAGAPC